MIEWTDWRRTRELLTPDEMAKADAAAIAAGAPGIELMARAGAAVADEAARLSLPLSRATPRIAVLCGPGNNGGDGYVAARLLAARGFQVRCLPPGDPACRRADPARAVAEGTGPGEPSEALDLAGFDVVIDGLFGA